MRNTENITESILRGIQEDDNSRRRRLLNIFLLVVSFLAVLILILAVIFQAQEQEGATLIFWSVPPVLLLLAGIYLLAKRRVQLGSFLFVILLIAGTLFSDTPEQVLEGRSLFFMIAPVMMASFIISPAASFYAAFVAGLGLLGLSFYSGHTMNFIGAVGFFIFAFVSWLAASVYETTLSELKVVNKELDQRVEARTQELADANERLKELDTLKSLFVSHVSHELRTPISNISMYLEMFEHGNPTKVDQYLSVLKGEAKRLTKLVKDTLDLSRLELQTSIHEFREVNINEICAHVIAISELGADAKGLKIDFIPESDLPPIWADGDQITQVVLNLVTNAVNYTKSGMVTIITFSQEKDGQALSCFRVEDTGAGISPQDLKHLFEPFFRGEQDSQSSIPGTGLGLAICQEIVQQHAGYIEVQSEIGMGSAFTVYFPQAEIVVND
ncbi:MAG: HAMP domain-containing histidine kinase [Anaerolineales bacterium]|nr:HAMP domain-containing histidine kinase [Anaerolineales bacterium]